MPIQKKVIAEYSYFHGVKVSFSDGGATNYLEMRTAHLAALCRMLCGDDFENWSNTIKADAKWLAATLAEEIDHLVPIVLDEVHRAASSAQTDLPA